MVFSWKNTKRYLLVLRPAWIFCELYVMFVVFQTCLINELFWGVCLICFGEQCLSFEAFVLPCREQICLNMLF